MVGAAVVGLKVVDVAEVRDAAVGVSVVGS